MASASREALRNGHLVARLLEVELADVGLSAGEAMVLGELEGDDLTMGGVMSALHIGASTATSLVRRLEERGLVRRTPNPVDARSVLVRLTAAGRRLSRRAGPVFSRLDRRIAEEGIDKLAGGL